MPNDIIRRKPLSFEHKQKLRLASLGRILSAETREKISSKLRGRKQSPEFIARRTASLKGRKNPGSSKWMTNNNPMKRPEVAAKMAKTKSLNPQNRINASNLMKRMRNQPEFQSRLTKSLRTPNFRMLQSLNMTANNPMKNELTVLKVKNSSMQFHKSGGAFGRMWRDQRKRKLALKNINIVRSSKHYKEGRSEWLSNRILAGKHLNGYGNRGYFYSKINKKKIFFRSFLERDAYILLEKNQSIVSYETESIKIPYILKGIRKYYVPDILVNYSDLSKRLIEVKPIYKFKIPFERLKLRVLKKYCKSNNLYCSILTEKEIYESAKSCLVAQ